MCCHVYMSVGWRCCLRCWRDDCLFIGHNLYAVCAFEKCTEKDNLRVNSAVIKGDRSRSSRRRYILLACSNSGYSDGPGNRGKSIPLEYKRKGYLMVWGW